MCLLDVREGGCADGGMEELEQRRRDRWRSNRRRLGEVWWNNNLSVFVSVCVSGEVCFVSVYLGFVFCNSCAFL